MHTSSLALLFDVYLLTLGRSQSPASATEGMSVSMQGVAAPPPPPPAAAASKKGSSGIVIGIAVAVALGVLGKPACSLLSHSHAISAAG